MQSETCRGEGILYEFNVFFNKYMHELVSIDTDSYCCMDVLTLLDCNVRVLCTFPHTFLNVTTGEVLLTLNTALFSHKRSECL